MSSNCSQYSFRNADRELLQPEARRRRVARLGQRRATRRSASIASSSSAADDAGHEQRARSGRVNDAIAHVEQHDHVDHEHHHRADVDQHLEHGDEVHAEQRVDAAQRSIVEISAIATRIGWRSTSISAAATSAERRDESRA